VTYVDVNGLPTWHEVHVPERRGHAHTHDVEGPLSYGVMADDTVAYLDRVVGGPEHFPTVYEKTLAMLATEPELDLASPAAVAAPTLVLQGDRDEVTLEHGAAVATALPNGRLAVLPGTHALPVEAPPEVVNALLEWFLAGARPAVDWTAAVSGG